MVCFVSPKGRAPNKRRTYIFNLYVCTYVCIYIYICVCLFRVPLVGGLKGKKRGNQYPSGRSLTFGFSFDQPLERVMLLSSLRCLAFCNDFNHPLEKATQPSTLQSLTVAFFYNKPLEGATLPSALRSLAFGSNFNFAQKSAKLDFWPRLQPAIGGGDFAQ